jgi:outer membrane lipoprotein-sorting protein
MMMKRNVLLLLMTLVLSTVAAFGQEMGIVHKELPPAEISRIIKKFSENESAFREALKDYVFNRRASVSTVGMGGQVTGTYRRDSFMTFNEDGGRFEKVLFSPISTLTELSITPEDLEDLGGVNAFALEPSLISQYNISYVGIERIDELSLYVFDVTPKVIPDPKRSKLRLFTGRVWVDTDDLMIVKSKGKAVPETKQNKFSIVESTREQIDGKYWFPVDARSDDELVFDSGQVVKLRMHVEYSDYKLGRSE